MFWFLFGLVMFLALVFGVLITNHFVYQSKVGKIPTDNVYVYRVVKTTQRRPLVYSDGKLVEDTFQECSVHYRDMNGNTSCMTTPDEVFDVFKPVSNSTERKTNSETLIVKKTINTTDFQLMVLDKLNSRMDKIKLPSQEELPALTHLKTKAFENVLSTLKTLELTKEGVNLENVENVCGSTKNKKKKVAVEV